MLRGLLLGLLGALLANGIAAQDLTGDQEQAILSADIVILGEIHDNPRHHLGQAALIERIAPKAVVFEMLSPKMAVMVNDRAGADLATLGQAIGWQDAGWPDFALYLPVFEALKGAVVMGAAAPRETVRQAFQKGAAAVFGPDAARFGLTAGIPPAQLTQRKKLQFDAHCKAMPLSMMGGMVEAQRLRDAQFSAAALQALKDHGAPVVVIAGNGHARRDWAMPFMIGQAAPEVGVYAVGFVETPSETPDPRFDATFVTDPAMRADPCAAFAN